MATNTTDLDQVSAEELQRHYWRGYTSDTSPEAARTAYLARYGQAPAHITRGLGGILLAGPIPAAPRAGAPAYDEAAL